MAETPRQQDFLHQGVGGPPDADLRKLYTMALTVRRLDEALLRAQRAGEVSFYVESRGEEVLQVVAAAALSDADTVFPGVRATGIYLQRGMTPEAWANQAFGTAEDATMGHGAPGFGSFREGRVVPVSSSLGTYISHGAGYAWAARLRKGEEVALVLFGDASVSQPDFHTGLNFAGVFHAPAVFLWKSRDPLAPEVGSVEERAEAYGIRGVEVSGREATEIWDRVREAVARARKGEGPTLLRAVLPSYEEILEEPSRRDPLVELRRLLEARGLWTEEEEEQQTASIDQRVEKALEAARAAAAPDRLQLFSQVFEGRPPHLVDQETEMLRGGDKPAGSEAT